jgi:hypothetical protein
MADQRCAFGLARRCGCTGSTSAPGDCHQRWSACYSILLQKSAATDDVVRPFQWATGFGRPTRRSLRNYYATQHRELEWAAVAQPAKRAAADSERWRPEQTHPGRLVDRVVEADLA